MKTAIVTMTGRSAPDQSSLRWREAFCEGLKRRGWNAQISTSPDPADLLVMRGIRRQDAIARQKAHGGEVVILERGYLAGRRCRRRRRHGKLSKQNRNGQDRLWVKFAHIPH